MRDKLDLLDLKIMEGLGEHGPRNMTELAKKLGTPRGTVLARIKRMSSSFYLRMSANVYHTNLGLKKAVVFAKAAPGNEELLFNCMKINKFYIYLTRCYGMFEGCLGIYVIPKAKCPKFEQFLQETKKLGVAQDIELFWSTCFHTVNRTTNWFDRMSEEWAFKWDRWVEEIPAQKEDLPHTLVDPADFPILADETDLFILKELEKNATTDLTDIAKQLGTTLQNVHHHYKMHIKKRGLLEVFQIFFLPFERAVSDMFFFIFKFDSYEKMAKFARSLLDKPFVYIVGKILGQNAMISQVYLPRVEFRRFVESLSKLARAGYLRSYDYVIQDLRPGKWSRETIPYQLFKNSEWAYDHQGYIESLLRVAKPNLTLPQTPLERPSHHTL
jgi:DNA-binding Lrp family transcriptional regulator